MQYAAIPTTYNGIEFRSRLEAKWAAFFDEMGWGYEYEPDDFDNYIPDFALLGRTRSFVEVKPFYSCSEADDKCDKARSLSIATGERVICLGSTINYTHDPEYHRQSYDPAVMLIGWAMPGCMDSMWECENGLMGMQVVFCGVCSRLSLHAPWGLWGCHLCDTYGKLHLSYGVRLESIAASVRLAWATATNATKYRHRRHT